MRWKLTSLAIALIAVTSAQFLTIDNIVIVQPDNVSPKYEDYNDTFADYIGHDNSSYNSETEDELPVTDDRAISANSAENENNNDINNGVPNSSPDAVSSRETRETSETTTHEQAQNKNESNDLTQSSESENESSTSQGESPEKLSGSENGSLQSRSSEETSEKPETEEAESNGDSGSGELASTENPASEESPEVQPPIGVSGETEEINIAEVQTTHGPVRGYMWPSNAMIVSFYDIPYGKFNKPFETPVTAQSWLAVHEATAHTKVCPQLENDAYTGDTNCLTLSIFKPKDADNASVLFHVYDSNANCTSADPLMYGPDYIVPKGVILVLPNYRIGPMGFLCMQNETALGNAALKDLSLALEWIRDNIHLFGGNPSNIVVSGDGAASAYAGYLAICSRSKYYINKVITESGSALSHWALDRNPIDTANTLAEKIRVEHSDGIVFNNTFAEVALDTIIKAAKGMRFKPCIEHDKEPFIDETPWKILQSKDMDTTFMIGSASFAGTHEATEMTADFLTQINQHFDLLLPEDLVFRNDDERKEFAFKLRNQYFGEENITASDIEELSLWYTDASYLSPGIRLARPLLSAGATVYLYEFAFAGTLNHELEALHRPVSGAVRGDLAGYLFHKDGTSVEQDSPEERMIELMVDLWVSFINSGKPVAANVEWNEFKKGEDEEEEWLLINTESKLKKGVHVERLRLWTTIYDKHFIDNSSGLRHTLHYLTLAAALMSLIANNKLNH